MANEAEAGKNAHTGEGKASSRTTKTDANGKKEKHGKYDGLSRKQKRRKMANEEEERENARSNVATAIRNAKKASRPVKITEPLKAKSKAAGRKDKKKKGGSKIKLGGKGSAFEHEGMRAKPVKVALDKKKGGGKGKAKAKVGKR